MQIDRKKRQVTLYDPSAFRESGGQPTIAVGMEERKIGVAAPKMFAFDGLFTADDSQVSFYGKRLNAWRRCETYPSAVCPMFVLMSSTHTRASSAATGPRVVLAHPARSFGGSNTGSIQI